jgi:hypothetical protein
MTRDIVESGTKKPIDEEYDKITQSFRKAPIIRDIKLEGVLSWGDRIAGNNPLLKVLVGPSIKAISKGILEFGIIFPLFAGGIAGIMQAVGEWLDRRQENKRAKDPAWKFAQQHPPPGLQSQIDDRDSGLASAGA